jgi:hypothetical protein
VIGNAGPRLHDVLIVWIRGPDNVLRTWGATTATAARTDSITHPTAPSQPPTAQHTFSGAGAVRHRRSRTTGRPDPLGTLKPSAEIDFPPLIVPLQLLGEPAERAHIVNCSCRSTPESPP